MLKSLHHPTQGSLNHTSGAPWAPITAQKLPKIPMTQFYFSLHCSGWLKSCCRSLNSHICTPLLINLPQPIQGIPYHTSGALWACIRAQKHRKIPLK